MASKKDAKTNKTAHVLSLLTEPEATKTQDAPEEIAPAAQSSPPISVPILEVVRANDDVISNQIRGALEKELDMDHNTRIEQTEPASKENAPDPAAQEREAALLHAAEQSALTDEPAPDIRKAEQEQGAAPRPIVPAPVAALPAVPGIAYINVMQAIVEEKVDKYIKMFGLCPCPRCRIDVIALSLTNLPAKYVVIREHEAIPMLTVYEGRYNAAVISQVMWACKKVMDYPRH